MDEEVRITGQEDDGDDFLPDESDEEFSIDKYAQHYLIFDDKRIQPAYKVNFHLDERGPLKINLAKPAKGQYGGVNDTTVAGQAVKDKCDKEGHGQRLLDFFCMNCNKGLCSNCLIHCSVEHKGHTIRETQECYQSVINDFFSKDSPVAVQTEIKKKKIKDQMEEIYSKMTRLQDGTRMKEKRLQSLFNYELEKIRKNFEYCSDRLRADFEELQRMDSELRATNRFAKREVSHWKRGYDSGIQLCQTKIYLIETTQTFRKLMQFLQR